ncbi:hypothetical protein LJC25_04060 [Bacteroidales bacterium OttesenSCG-928-K03]|nr:hypothetical protein [Bacteroidales bacterium OttesenSCG-928-K03]
MKKIFLILFCSFFINITYSQTSDTIFYETGKIKIIRTKISDNEVYGRFFAENGRTLIAEGKYVDKERDSLWSFYNYNGILNSTETYDSGKKNGISHIYYPDGTIGETLEWQNDLKHGVWKQFFSNGITKTDANYIDGELNGEIKFFHPNSKLNIHGYYKNGARDSLWLYFDDQGNLLNEEKYENGFLLE